MQPLEDLRFLLFELVSTPAFQQLFPFFVVLLIPLLVFAANSRKGTILSTTYMVFEAFSAALPWNWFDTATGSNVAHEKRRSRKKLIRTRAEQVKELQLGAFQFLLQDRTISTYLCCRTIAQGGSDRRLLSGASEYLRHVLLHEFDLAGARVMQSCCPFVHSQPPRQWRLFAIYNPRCIRFTQRLKP